MITKQNYIKIAEILNKFLIGFNTQMLIEDLSLYFKEDNPLFNEVKFKDAVYKK